MSKNFKVIALVAALGVVLPQAVQAEKVPYTHEGFYTNAPTQVAVHFVNLKGIEESLKDQPPMTVSFDIDDTVLFSSGYFHYGFTFGKNFGWGNTPREVLDNQGYWDYLAEQADKHSIPKESAKKIIEMHLKRGDKIVFITGRTKHSQNKNGIVTETSKVLQQYFNLPEAPAIWYTASTPQGHFKHDKAFYIDKVGSKLHYGDSDDDILSAREAGVRGIRVQRSYSSTNSQKMNGGYGEEVLINSAW